MRSVAEEKIKEKFLKIYSKELDNLKDVMWNNKPIIYGYIILLDSKRDSEKYKNLNKNISRIKDNLTNLFGEGSVLSYVIDNIYNIFNNEEDTWYDVVIISTIKSNIINRFIFPFEILHYLNIFVNEIDELIQNKYVEELENLYESYEKLWTQFSDDDDVVVMSMNRHSSIILSFIYKYIVNKISDKTKNNTNEEK